MWLQGLSRAPRFFNWEFPTSWLNILVMLYNYVRFQCWRRLNAYKYINKEIFRVLHLMMSLVHVVLEYIVRACITKIYFPNFCTVHSCWQSGQRLFCLIHKLIQQWWNEWLHSPHTTCIKNWIVIKLWCTNYYQYKEWYKVIFDPKY